MKSALMILTASLVLGSGYANAGIINGQEVSPGQFSPVVELYIDGVAECTATIIGPRVIITAAHCTGGKSQKAHFFLNGEKHEVHLQPSRFYSQQDYEDDRDPHDITLGLIKKPLESAMATIGGQTELGKRVQLVGYGKSDDSQASAGVLRKGENDITYAVQGGRLMMVGPNANGASGHDGDSGGPIFIRDAFNHQLRLVGVMSSAIQKEGRTIGARTDNIDSAAIFSEFTNKNRVGICGINLQCREFDPNLMTENIPVSNRTSGSPAKFIR
jgi:hypothetical protein